MRDDVAGENEEEVHSQISASDKGQDCFDAGRYVLLRVHREHQQRCQRPDAGQAVDIEKQ
jgi:hypothetical protein